MEVWEALDNEETNIETSNNKKNAESVTAGAGGTMQTGGMNEQAADTVRAKNAALEADVGELTQKKDYDDVIKLKELSCKICTDSSGDCIWTCFDVVFE